MRAIVLVKQVPDVRVGSVGMRPDGTIDRSSAAAITNPTDLHALEAALQLADEIWALSMGPAQAETTLREAIALGADRGILLTDRLFAGSDTWATANALAAAIEHLGGADLMLGGTSALDGETGNVGPQVAERLSVPHLTGCEELEKRDDRLIARRIVEGGYETVSLPMPAVVTIAETGFSPRYPTLPGRRKAAHAEIELLSAAELSLDDTLVGLSASPTKVAHMELVPLPKTICRLVDDSFTYENLVGELLSSDSIPPPQEGPIFEEESVSTVTSRDGHPDVWVVCEVIDGHLSGVSVELLAEAVRLGVQLAVGVTAVLIGSALDEAVEKAAEFGADLILVGDDERLSHYRGIPEAKLIAEAISQRSPQIVLLGATTTGRSLAPRIAAIVGTGLAADCTDLFIANWERRGQIYPNLLHQVRPAMAGGVLATCLCPESRPQMATVRPGVFTASKNPRTVRRKDLDIRLDPADLAVEVLERRIERTDVSLADAEVVVAGGAGCGAANWHLVEELAETIGGKVAASRAAVEAGLAPRAYQVGQTGTTVSPKLYIACGISGALQHVVGMKGSSTVLAINRDPEAAIFRFAHYGIVGDVTEVLPKLSVAIAAHKARE
jgi:electron transfer flavoprotein alpha subunit